MIRQSWPSLPDGEALEDVEWSFGQNDGDFWAYVDSQESVQYRRCGCDGVDTDSDCTYWPHVRGGAYCIAARSDRTRCVQAVLHGTPFCEFHMRRAWHALTLAAAEEKRIQLAASLRFEESRHQNDILALHARTGYENALRMDVVRAASKLPERVYFFAVEHAVKIGRSVHPERRVRTLKGTKSPAGIDLTAGVLLGTIPGGTGVEHDLHRRFAKHRLEGEWFALDPIRMAVDALLGHELAARSEQAAS